VGTTELAFGSPRDDSVDEPGGVLDVSDRGVFFMVFAMLCL
jgi:hypothetical protein